MTKKIDKTLRREKRREKKQRQHQDSTPKAQAPKPKQFDVIQTSTHKAYQHALFSRDRAPVLCLGSAGTGKTFGAIKAAMVQLEAKHIKRIIVLRPQETFAAKAGYLPGTEREKLEPWIRPIHQNLKKLGYSQSAIELMEKNEVLCYYDLGMVQGLTFDQAMIIIDEPQNMTYEQIEGVLTREGMWSRTVFCGDVRQTSPKFNNSGLPRFIDMVQVMNSDIHYIEMTRDDVVRSPRCKQWIADFEDYEAGIRPNDYKDMMDEPKPDPLSLYDEVA
ncbi:PhoH-like protein [Vibrio phage 1.238.A._10N.261.52.F10]|uniref:PhoH-like protein n=1 Tax=Vibrio phage 1.238.A._10N.261.52.F10 TaxID=1881231 RepID=A0A2I7RUF4_9CAUD|nr:PhoH-like phosphate starvation-inducible [Vibrio phage 1.238.A._10N.261.52.F10]AUR97269.1 PhoH-like protein [Vibrio phage 1.238.A._10N.261.52.F10]AUR97363.1 PhoH-like protein [Vibrio phage 1.238.B._10N.261.52.F10]